MRVFTVSFAITVYEGESFDQKTLEASIAEDVTKALDSFMPVCGVSDVNVHEVTSLVQLIGQPIDERVGREG